MSEERRSVVNPETCTVADLQAAADWLTQGGIVAFPTDTLYGLAVSVHNSTAVRRLFDLKGRAAGAAIPLIAASRAQVVAATGPFSASEARLAAAFWPGPLSLVREAPAWLPPAVHGGHHTVAVRVPNCLVACRLAEACGSLITATSANRSGEIPADAVGALSVWADHPHVWIVDGGRTPGGAPSTIVDVRGAEPICVREGAIAWSRVLNSLHS